MGFLQPGDEIDIWVVDRALGQGGMGSVYRCHNREAKRILAAVKVLDASFARLPTSKARFIREAEILFSLDHPGIVKVRNVRMDLELPYLEMEYIDGINLEARAQDGALSAVDALPLLKQVADALAYLHARGIRHRDVKPSNLLIQPSGRVKLVDFGIATESDGATLTELGQTFGSVSYAPPEWLDPERLDPVKWDIYSAGIVFYELLTGRQAFPMPGIGTMQQQVVRLMSVKQRHPPLDPGPAHPAKLRALVRDMTNPWPESRLADMRAVVERLAAVDFEVDLNAAAVSLKSSEPTWYTDPAEGDQAVAGLTMVPGREDGPPAPSAVTPPAPPPPAHPQSEGAPALSAPARSSAPRLALAALGLAACAAGGAWAYTALVVPPTRDVVVTITGLAEGVPVAVTLGGAAPAAVDGRRVTFRAVPTGAKDLRAAIGAGCDTGPQAPSWCGQHAEPLQIEGAHEPLAHTLALAAPAPRVVTVSVQGLPEGSLLQASVDGGAAVSGSATTVSLPDVAPGPRPLRVWVGACTPEDAGCANDGSAATCTPGCASWAGEHTVPAGTGAFAADVVLPAPVAPAAPTAAAAVSATRGASARRSGPGSIVTVTAFARWLTTHPEWTGDGARAAGKADGTYLSGWSNAEPPAGKGAGAVVNVSWAAAAAYCAGRGGLPGMDDAPLTWTESGAQPWHEYRVAGDRPAWRRSDGATSIAVKRTESGPVIGFRCAR
ncbi:MAG: serine/threonine-protein kinase [Pseudomonadota bacterium]|nr:serine/threonine-protein kinase [Pseudomonadota bacterium]